MNKHNELIGHIRESLKRHEEPYTSGAWEKFQQYQKARGKVATSKRILTVAASLILLLSLMFILNDFGDMAPVKPVVEYPEEGNTRRPDNGESNSTRPPANQRNSAVVVSEDRPDEETVSASGLASNGVTAPLPEDTLNTNPGIFRQLNPVLISASAAYSLPGVQRAAEHSGNSGYWPEPDQNHEQYSDKILLQDKNKKFSLGLACAPLMNANDTKTEWSMGGGLYTEWNFTRDLALSSGVIIAQNQLEYGREEGMEDVGTNNLADVQVDLVSLEIPLNLRYYLTDDISVSAGISSAAFLKEHYNYTYEYKREIQTLIYTEGAGFEPVTTTVTVTESDKQSEPSFNAVDWAAFYTFSLGYQYDISGDHTLSLEPFVKLPSGRLTSRNIKYYTGGLQVKISF